MYRCPAAVSWNIKNKKKKKKHKARVTLEEGFPQHGNSKLFMIKSYKADVFTIIKSHQLQLMYRHFL